MNASVFGRMAAPTCDDPAVFRNRRRFSDPVSPLNCDLHDAARMLAAAVEMVDGLGLEILSVDADRQRNRRILVNYSPLCAALEGVEYKRGPEWSHWTASRFGVEIRWCVPVAEVAA